MESIAEAAVERADEVIDISIPPGVLPRAISRNFPSQKKLGHLGKENRDVFAYPHKKGEYWPNGLGHKSLSSKALEVSKGDLAASKAAAEDPIKIPALNGKTPTISQNLRRRERPRHRPPSERATHEHRLGWSWSGPVQFAGFSHA